MALGFDLSGMTAGETRDLGMALGCNTLPEMEAKIASIDTGNLPLDVMVPMLWLAARQSRPTLTLSQAAGMPLTELTELGMEASHQRAQRPETKARQTKRKALTK